MHKNDFADKTKKHFIMTMGAPGCGKNHFIDNFLTTMVADNVGNWDGVCFNTCTCSGFFSGYVVEA